MQNQQNQHDQQNQQGLEVQDLSFQELPVVQDLSTSGNLIQNYIKGYDWINSFNCITQLRKINKYHTQYIPDIIERFSATILDLLNTGKPLLVKNIFKLIKQLFDAGQQVNVQKAVYAFLPVLLKKGSTEIGHMKSLAQQVLTSFSCNCGYQSSLLITSQFCCDKNSSIAELSLKVLGTLLQNVGAAVMQLSENTLITLMRSLFSSIDGKRKNLQTLALDICIYVCNSINADNYLQLMQFCLKPDEVQAMGDAMQSHRISKDKPLSLKTAIQNKKSEAFNCEFFNEKNNSLNQNFIPLSEHNCNISNNGYNQYNQYQQNNGNQNSNYNGNQQYNNQYQNYYN